MFDIIGTYHCLCSIMSDSLCPYDSSPSGSSVHEIFQARLQYWRGFLFPPSGLLPDPGIERASPVSPALAGTFFITEPGNYLSLTLGSVPSSPQGALVVRNPPASAGDPRVTGSIPGLGRSPGGGNGNPLQYSCMGNPILCLWGPKESSQLSTNTHLRSQAQEGSSHSCMPHPWLAIGP